MSSWISKKWNIEDYSLPSDLSDSEADADSDNEFPDLSHNESSSSSDNADSEEDDVEYDVNNWTQNVRNFTRELNFEQEPKIAVEIDKNYKEIDFFNLFFDKSILENIVKQSNLYRSQKQGNSHYDYDLNVPELQAWMGIILLMGIHRMPQLKNYWSKDPAIRVEFIANIMPRDRFHKITEILRVNDNNNNLP